MSKINIDKKLLASVKEYRDRIYQQAYEDAKDEGDEDYTLRDHLENEYNNCDINELVDQIQDLILDSIGS
jgi:hypothetical protein